MVIKNFSKIKIELLGMIMNTSTPINNLLMTIDLKDISSNSSPPASTNNIYQLFISLSRASISLCRDAFLSSNDFISLSIDSIFLSRDVL